MMRIPSARPRLASENGDEHNTLYAAICRALFGHDVTFGSPTEKWIVWPATRDDVDPREDELRVKGIRVVGYYEDGEGGYGLRVGAGC